jgi:hypothetical protein
MCEVRVGGKVLVLQREIIADKKISDCCASISYPLSIFIGHSVPAATTTGATKSVIQEKASALAFCLPALWLIMKSYSLSARAHTELSGTCNIKQPLKGLMIGLNYKMSSK